MRKVLDGGFSVIFLVVLLSVIPVQARPQSEAAGTIPVTTVVTALGSKFTAPPAVSKDDVTIREGKDRRDITNWIPAQGDRAGLQLAIVIDDSLQKSFGNQLCARGPKPARGRSAQRGVSREPWRVSKLS